METAQKDAILKWVRLVLENTLSGKPLGEPGEFGPPSGAFVTLHKKGRLRGCIGYMQADDQPLADTLKDAAISAALRDTRFPQVEAKEMADIDIEVSVLTPFEEVRSIEDIVVGRHGLYLVSGRRGGVFLPQVPTEQGWNLEEYLENLCYKAGLPVGSWEQEDSKLYSFEAEVFGEKD